MTLFLNSDGHLSAKPLLMAGRSNDDGIPASRLPEFFDESKLWAFQDEFSNVDWFGGSPKFGGSPRWTGNGPMNSDPSFQFLFQLGEHIHMPGQGPHPDAVGCRLFFDDKEKRHHIVQPTPGKEKKNAPFYIAYTEGSEGWFFDYINLGTDGMLFVFINRATTPHQVTWDWKR